MGTIQEVLSKASDVIASGPDNVSFYTVSGEADGNKNVLFATQSSSENSTNIVFVDTDNDASTFEGIYIDGQDAFYVGGEDVKLLTDFAREALRNDRNRFLDTLSVKGKVTDIDASDIQRAFGRKEDGTPRKIVVVVPHQDDEILMAGTLATLVKMNGPENVMVLYTSNGDGSEGGRSAVERDRYFTETKMPNGLRSCNQLGIPSENVKFLNISEVEFYNSFISPRLKEMEAAGEPMPRGVRNNFERIDDPVRAQAYQVDWIHYYLKQFGADVVITDDLEYTVQLHDWTHVTTKMAVAKYQEEKGEDVLLVGFPQQNVNRGMHVKPGKKGRLINAYYQEQIEAHGAMRVTLTDEMKAAKKKALDSHKGNFTDGLIFLSYATMFGLEAAKNMKKFEHFHLERDLAPVVTCPNVEECGYEVFEGNNEHLGVEHHCEDDFRTLPDLVEYLKTYQFTEVEAESDMPSFDRALWQAE